MIASEETLKISLPSSPLFRYIKPLPSLRPKSYFALHEHAAGVCFPTQIYARTFVPALSLSSQRRLLARLLSPSLNSHAGGIKY